MAKWKISSQFNNSSSWYVTFSANSGVSGYYISGYSYGRDVVTAANSTISISNVRNNDGTTATFTSGIAGSGGNCSVFPGWPVVVVADQNAFVTIAHSSPFTGTLAVYYDIVPK